MIECVNITAKIALPTGDSPQSWFVRGKAKGPYQQGQKLNLIHGGYVATLRLTDDEKAGFPRNWVLTGYGPEGKSEGGKR